MRTDPRGKHWTGELLAGHTGIARFREKDPPQNYYMSNGLTLKLHNMSSLNFQGSCRETGK